MEVIEVSGNRATSRNSGEFDDFVSACPTRLLRTAHLLTRDHGNAEDLLQTAMASNPG